MLCEHGGGTPNSLGSTCCLVRPGFDGLAVADAGQGFGELIESEWWAQHRVSERRLHPNPNVCCQVSSPFPPGPAAADGASGAPGAAYDVGDEQRISAGERRRAGRGPAGRGHPHRGPDQGLPGDGLRRGRQAQPRRRCRRDLRLAGSQRRGENHHRGHADHARGADIRQGVPRRDRRGSASGAGKTVERHRFAAKHPRPPADGVGEPVLSRAAVRHGGQAVPAGRGRAA